MQNYVQLIDYIDGTSEIIGSDVPLEITQNCAFIGDVIIPLHIIKKLTRIK